MRCDEFAGLRTALVEDCLDDTAMLAAEAHVAVCDRCSEELATELGVKAALAQAVEPAPARLRRSIERSLRPRHYRMHQPLAVAAALVAVLLAIAATAGIVLTGSRHAPVARAEVLADDYESTWTGDPAGTTGGRTGELAAMGLGLVGHRDLGGDDAAVEADYYTGPGGRVAVYTVDGSVAAPEGATTRPRGWVLDEDAYRTLTVSDGSHTTVLMGTLTFDALERAGAALDP